MFHDDGALSHVLLGRLLSRRQLFHAADLARALKVIQQAGLTVARVEIEPMGKMVLHMPDSIPDHDAPDPVLEAVRRKIVARRTERLAKVIQT